MKIHNLPCNSEYSTLVELLTNRSYQQGEQTAYIYLADKGSSETSISYRELDAKARAIAGYLQSLGKKGERALLFYPPGLDYIAAFLGCLYAQVIAVPVYPPQFDRNLSRLPSILRDAQPTVALSTEQIANQLQHTSGEQPELANLQWITTDTIDIHTGTATYQHQEISAHTLAFLQYTSGSTASPKGVALTHGNLLNNLARIHQGFGLSAKSYGCVWLPPYHDMGLIGGILGPLFGGFPVVLLSPMVFLQQPVQWLKAISKYRASVSGGPNFAYDLCARRVTAEQKEALDLSCWEVAFTGAEPVHGETLERFSQAFASCGFRHSSFYSCYGLAESTLMVTGGEKGIPPIIQPFERTALTQNQVLKVAKDFPGQSQTLVGCGITFADQTIKIVHPETLQTCSSNEIGEIWVKSPSVAQGYWEHYEKTEETFHAYTSDTDDGPFLRTGDLGFLDNGELFVTGRLKDSIIIRGRNYYPQDIEHIVETCYPGLRQQGCVAFSIPHAQEEQLVIVQEVERQAMRQFNYAEAVHQIAHSVTEHHGLQVAHLIFVKQGSISRTSSGKVQRQKCRQEFLSGRLVELKRVSSATPSPSLPLELASEERLTPQVFAELTPDAQRFALETFLHKQITNRCPFSPEWNTQLSLNSLGLDSLAAMELKNELEEYTNSIVPITVFFEDATIADLLDIILVSLSSSHDVVPHKKSSSEENEQDGDFPLSFGQRALWFINKLAPSNAAYNIARAMIVHNDLDEAALKQALHQLIQRHTALRTTFLERNNQVVQHIQENLPLPFLAQDITNWNDEAVARYLEECARKPFDLEHGPLLHFHLLKSLNRKAILLVVIHHISTDFLSISILLRELALLYHDHDRTHQPAPLTLPDVATYKDFVHWQARFLESPAGIQARDYWREQLCKPLPVLDLPTDKARPSVQTYRGATTHLALDLKLTQALQTLAHEQRVTPYTLLLSGFFALLYRYTGQDDLILGSPIAGRSHPQWTHLVGYLINTIIVRAHLSERMSFLDLLQQVRQKVVSALEHQDYPFALMVEEDSERRDTSHSPLFQVLFGFEKGTQMDSEEVAAFALGESGAHIQAGEMHLESLSVETQAAQFDLTVMMGHIHETFIATIEYNTDLFQAATIQRLWGHFQELLKGVVQAPTQSLATLSMLTPNEYKQIVIDWNATQPLKYKDTTICALIEKQVAATPDNVALVYKGLSISYKELNTRVNKLAHYLRRRGVGPEVRVGLFFDRCPELIIALLGVLKAGGAFVPFDPSYPPERIDYMCADAQVDVLLSQVQWKQQSSIQRSKHVIYLDAEITCAKDESSEDLVAFIQAEHLAYIIYTSGSSGRPKGVLLTHRGLSNLAQAQIQAFHVQAGDRVLQFASISFDAAVSEIFMALASGARLVLAPREDLLPREPLGKLLGKEEISVVTLPPSVLTRMTGWSLPRLRSIISAGETLSIDLAQEWMSNHQLYNAYGPTEITVCATLTSCNNLQMNGQHLSIGHALANTEVFIFDRHNNPVPVGVPGEIYLGGQGLARGYLNQSGLTAERFVPHPFSTQPGARLYRTGDLARFLNDGSIEYLGRADHQIKLRGFRIELEEIETVLASHKAIQECSVTTREDKVGNTLLVAYITFRHDTPQQDGTVSTNALQAYLWQRLPGFMVPNLFIQMDALPRTANGKKDRQALPALDGTHPELQTTYQEPRTQVEQILASFWIEMLGYERIGIHDNFFALGGHSLMATQIVSRVHDLLDTDIPLQVFFAHPTIAAIADFMQQNPEQEARLEQIAQMTLEVSQLSDENVHDLLAEKGAS